MYKLINLKTTQLIFNSFHKKSLLSVILFKNYSVNIQHTATAVGGGLATNLKTTQLIFNAHKIKPHNIYQSLYS